MNDLVIKLFASICTHTAIIILIYSIFKIKILDNHKQVAVLSLATGLVHFYIRFGLDSMMYFPVTTVVLLLGLMVLRNYPFWYAFLISAIGYFLAGLVDEVVTSILLSISGINLADLLANNLYFVSANLISSLLMVALARCLIWKSWGFNFIYKRFENRRWILRSYNFVWASVLLVSLGVIQISVSKIVPFTYPWIFVSASTFVFVAAIWITYRENRKVKKDLDRIIRKWGDEFDIY